MITKTKHRLFLIPMIVFGLVLMISTAQAIDYKTHSGNMCQPYFGTNQSQVDHRINGVYNRGNSGVWVSCPIVRDNWDDPNGLGGTTWVRVNRSNATAEPLTCTLRSISAFTKATLGSASDSFGGTGFDWLGLNITGAGRSQAWGPYMMFCRLPARSTICSYTVYERSPTDPG